MKIKLYKEWQRHVIGAALLCGAAVIAAILITFNASDPSWLFYDSDHPVASNWGGIQGAQWAVTILYFFGVSSYFLVILLFYCGYIFFCKGSLQKQYDVISASLVAICLSCALCSFHSFKLASYLVPGGVIGRSIVLFLHTYMQGFMLYVALVTGIVASVVIALRVSWTQVLSFFIHVSKKFFHVLRRWIIPCMIIVLRSSRLSTRALYRHCSRILSSLYRLIHGQDVVRSGLSIVSFENGTARIEQEEDLFWVSFLQTQSLGGHTVIVAAPIDHAQKISCHLATLTYEAGSAVDQQLKVNEIPKKPLYVLPIVRTLFQKTERTDYVKHADEQKIIAKALEEKLSRFGILGSVVAIKPGPVVTLFEYQPSIDAKISKIMGLESDLALALEALSVRISAPIPGTSRIGFEVANKKREAVFLRDMMHGKVFEQVQMHLPLILGKDTSGGDVVIDLVDMPHLLIAGSTGSGKSVALNTLLISLLCKKSPDELKLIIVDPKRLEFCAYDGIPHLLFPIITQPQKVGSIMQWLVGVMEERYERMAAHGVRGIFDYKKWCMATGNPDELPFIVVIIDELADLMMVARKDIEDNIARLAQMARAAGIYLIVATQRPSVDVLTGVIKVNFPSRISFRVTSKVDSRTILDVMGAETLLGKGDMLFMDSHSASLRRLHGPYVTDAEIRAVVEHVKSQQSPQYIDLQDALALQQGEAWGTDDPILKEVYAFLQTVNDISISLLQRRFRIGYNRAARLIEMLESQGKILPADGAKMRKVVH